MSKDKDIVDWIEEVFDIKLFDYQKKTIRYLDTHPDAQIQFGRGGRSIQPWYYYYSLMKCVLQDKSGKGDKNDGN